QYADYAHWQQQWMTGEVLEAELAYWREQLAGAPPCLELPTDRPRPAVQTYRGRHLPVVLPEALSGALAALAREHGATLFMTLLAAFKALLNRWTGQERIAVGSPIAGRTHKEIEDLIGLFINTLVLHTDLSGGPAHPGTANRGPAYQELLAWVRRVALGAYAHQDVPFERLVEELQPDRDMSFSPLFQVMFVLQNAPRAAVETAGLTLSSFPSEVGTAKFDLTLSLQESGTGVSGA
ncbi:MAG: non-ribosomal peptide synthetase, partial [bacterium]|nr:non-ribosomal peptide synthetase [bacterium]